MVTKQSVDPWQGHTFTTAGGYDDSSCDNCGINMLKFQAQPFQCPNNKPPNANPDPLGDMFEELGIEVIDCTPKPTGIELGDIVLQILLGIGLFGGSVLTTLLTIKWIYG